MQVKRGVFSQRVFTNITFVHKYTVDAYKDALRKVNFPNYELFNDINEA